MRNPSTNQTFIIQSITLLQHSVSMRYAKGKKMATYPNQQLPTIRNPAATSTRTNQ